MKNLFAILAGLSLVISVSSCSRCVTCAKGDERTKLCDKDWNSHDVHDQVDFYENLGWQCRASSAAYLNE